MEAKLISFGIAVVSAIQARIPEYLEYGPDVFARVSAAADTTVLDLAMEIDARAQLNQWFKAELPEVPKLILGEERFKRLPARGESLDLYDVSSIASIPGISRDEAQQIHDRGVVVLLDVVDGTKLIMRELSNWGSAVAFYECLGEVLVAMVGDAFGRIYYATRGERGVRVVTSSGERGINGPSSVGSLRQASLCFYGQSPSAFKSFVEMPGFANLLDALQPDGRIYNFGGNPMLVKVADGQVDAVVELRGQRAHDAVPGLFIAIQAGATVRQPDGRVLDFSGALRYPARKSLRYIVTSTSPLFEAIRPHVHG